MKKLIGLVLTAVGLSATGSASAGLIDTQYVDQFMDDPLETALVTHYVPDLFYTGGTLTIVLKDDGGDGGESAFVLDLLSGSGIIPGGASYSVDLGPLGLAALNLLNSYTYSLTRVSGDFWFKKSILDLETTASVPEPGTLLLLGGGLLGFAMYRRRRANS